MMAKLETIAHHQYSLCQSTLDDSKRRNNKLYRVTAGDSTHNASPLLWMTLQFMGFSDLPTELALLIFKYAARPNFAQPDTHTPKNPYSSALSLSYVSKVVRRTVLPELLYTVSLPEARHVAAFILALRTQKKYVDRDLSLDYASCVHRMWIGECRGPLRDSNAPFITNFTPSAAEPDSEPDVSLLAPVILAVPSLAIEFVSLDILLGCLKYVCNSDVDLNVDHINSPLPWSTKSLTLSGSISFRWWSFMGTIHGYTFLTSIQHLTLLSSDTCYETHQHFAGDCANDIEPQDSEPYTVPFWMARAPFKKLQTFSRLIPHREQVVAECVPASSAKAIWVELITFPASLLPDHWTLQEIKTFMETQAQVGSIPSIPLPVSCSRRLCVLCLDREKIWAYGCEGPGPLVQASA
ncbi:uncharacterized protein BJ212DRAFT_641872 [Suillus subaureus]|uniref:F-box domain-containing protein n=1 Tax=Suillus subaureus TaxID=48587 RepID=A0A9P7E190_9AGAM|nr:uncharacterized protein BJ212DRAFT_641872 [Suillus subaureus]KAG1808643.1 hypothetical protein BJ212DRAFT_641872 [Suillus subaureus]